MEPFLAQKMSMENRRYLHAVNKKVAEIFNHKFMFIFDNPAQLHDSLAIPHDISVTENSLLNHGPYVLLIIAGDAKCKDNRRRRG